MTDNSLWIILQRMRLPFVVILITYTIAMVGLVLIPGVDNNGNEYHMSIFDAFYFVTYTATTIGFGELPYPFTHHQKIWVSISIYLTVIGWFYGIGALVSLLQNRVFLSEIAIAKFRRSVRKIEEDFVIVLGYNETTSEIIKRLLVAKIRVVVIEKDKIRADYLLLEGFVPNVPILVRDAHNPIALEYAGIRSRYCKGIISLFNSNILNLRMTISAKLLNKKVKIIVKATTQEESENLEDAGADIIDNPFLIMSYQLEMALKAPSLFKLENWLYKTDTLESKTFSIPDSDIIICGYGRLGFEVYKMFKKNNVFPTAIEINKTKVESAKYSGIEKIIHGNADDKSILEVANIEDAKLIIIATNNDTTNLSILSTVRKLNPKLLVVMRENEINDFSIFSHANIDRLYIPKNILINKATNAMSNPLAGKMIRAITQKDELWGQKLMSSLIKTIGLDPIIFELTVTSQNAYQLHNYLQNEENSVTLELLKSSRRDKKQNNNLIPLFIKRQEKEILLPDDTMKIRIDDNILFAGDENAKDDLEYVVNNAYEFKYIIS